MLRRILIFFAVTVITLVLALFALGVALEPPVLMVPFQERMLLPDVTVVNPGQARSAGLGVVIQDGMFRSVRPVGDTTNETRVARTMGTKALHEYGGAYVLPGLIDMHVHHPFAFDRADRLLFGLLYLAHGVTSVRDTGNFDDSILALRGEVIRGTFPGPRIFACGPILDGDPPWLPGARRVRDAAEAKAAVDELAEQGVDCIKIYSLIRPAVLTAIRESAAEHGLPVIGHVPVFVPFEEAHLDDVQHLTGAPPHAPIHRRSEFFRWWGESWRLTDDARMDFVVRTSVEQKIAHTPTLVVSKQYARFFPGSDVWSDADGSLLPRNYRDVVWGPTTAVIKPEEAELLRQAVPKMEALVGRLHQAGVRIHAGSDTLNPFVVPGASLYHELANLVDAGFTAEEAWVAATRAAGESLRVAGLGTVAEGAPADCLVFRRDPTTDLANLSTLEAVIAQGRLYPRKTLEEALSRHRTYFEGALYDGFSTAVARVTTWWLGRLLAKDLEIVPLSH